VSLDVGGVIYDDECYARAMLAGLRDLVGDVNESEFRVAYDRLRNLQAGSFREGIARRFLPDGDSTALGEAAEKYWHYPSSALYLDVQPMLREISKSYTICVIANQRSLVRHALERDGVSRFIDVWALSEDVGVEKPDPAIFEFALAQAHVSPKDAVHVGNRLDTDIRAAKSLGVRGVWLLRGEAPACPSENQVAEADCVIESLSELPACLDMMESKASQS